MEVNNINNTAIAENLKKGINTGIIAMVNPVEDFYLRQESINSWFIVGHYKVEGHTVDCLFHLMSMFFQDGRKVLNANFSLSDETTHEYYSDDKVYPFEQCKIERKGDELLVECPSGSLRGNLDKAVWKAGMPQGSTEIEVESMGLPIWNAGGGLFASPFDKPFHQYSIPCQRTNGKLIINGNEHNVENGQSWFDRQWQDHGKLFMGSKWRWSWMNLNLDNGDVISLWDMKNFTTGLDQAWGTVQHPDGTQSTVTMQLLKESEREFWTSEKSGQTYPTRWTVRFPELDAELDIRPIIRESEIVSDVPLKITMPDGDGMEGNIYHSQWKVDLPESKIDVGLVTYGMVLYDAGTGTFPTCFNRPFNQYSVPDMRANGTINLNGKEYRLKDCKVWFDRQWDVEGAKTGNATSSTELFSGLKWTWSWMDINLDNGEDMSLWDMHNITNKYHYTWATVLHKDGSQTSVPIENLTVGASDFWRSEKSGQNYPTKFVVRIPDYDAELTVTSVKKEQEIASDIKFLNKYEGASTVEGTYKGKKVKGYTYVEMLGNWE